MRRAVVVVALVLASSGCQGRFGPDNACRTVQAAQCRFQFRCCTFAERQQFGGAGGGFILANEEDCLELGSQFNPVCIQLGAVNEMIDTGHFEYDAEKAEGCFGPLVDAADACDPEAFFAAQQAMLGQGAGCRGAPFFGDGTVEDEGTCQLDAECASGGRCQRDDVPGDIVTIDGTCVAPPAIGEPCGDGFCGRDAFCPGFFGEGEGEGEGLPPQPALVCTELRADGERCNNAFECASNLCDFGSGGGVCTDVVANGDLDFRVCDGTQRELQ